MSSFMREAGAAVVLITLTLSLQCAGMAALISFAKPSLAPDDLRLGPLRSALLMLRLMQSRWTRTWAGQGGRAQGNGIAAAQVGA